MLPTQALPREAVDFSIGYVYPRHVPLPTYSAYLQPKGITCRFYLCVRVCYGTLINFLLVFNSLFNSLKSWRLFVLTVRPQTLMSLIKVSKNSSKQFKVLGYCCWLVKNIGGDFLARDINNDFFGGKDFFISRLHISWLNKVRRVNPLYTTRFIIWHDINVSKKIRRLKYSFFV